MIRTAVLTAAAMLATPAAATTYSLVNDFGNPVFKYGTVDASNNFTAFASSDCSNIGVTGLCYRGSDTYQVEFQRDANNLVLHPGPNAGENTMLMFTAPKTGLYTFNTTFTRGDSGDGVGIYSFGTGGLTFIGNVDAGSPTFTYAGSQFFTAGQVVGLGVERGGANHSYFNDSTFFSGSISGPVPEPASWALMLGGFGLMGAAMRRRTRVSVVYA